MVKGAIAFWYIVYHQNKKSKYKIKKPKKADKDILESSGSSGLFFPSKNHIHVVFGPQVEFVRHAVDDIMRGNSPDDTE